MTECKYFFQLVGEWPKYSRKSIDYLNCTAFHLNCTNYVAIDSLRNENSVRKYDLTADNIPFRNVKCRWHRQRDENLQNISI